MGGGEVARYVGKYGTENMRKAVILSGIPPFLLKTPDNPDGVPQEVFDSLEAAATADRYTFFTEFFKNFYNVDVLLGKRVSEQVVQTSWNVAVGCSATATVACIPSWHTDFRHDLARFDIPTLVMHGDADRILPINASGAKYVVVKDGPHNIAWTHADIVNSELVEFLQA
jgi:non-heme chloroperoxidase